MTLRLTFLRETALARLYKFSSGQTVWIPRSVVTSTVKFKPKDDLDVLVDQLPQEVHELTIEDWWWDKWESREEGGFYDNE